MSKGKDEGGPYRAQGPGVPPDSPPREVPDPIFAEVLGQVLRGGLRPPMKRIEPVKVRWVPVTYTVEGKAGELQQVSRPIFFRFRAEEFFAMDTSSRLSHGTVIENVFHGAESLIPNGGIPSWLFYEWIAPEDRTAIKDLAALVGTKKETPEARSAKAQLRIVEAANKMTWPVFHPGLSVTWGIRFYEACRWEGVLWGWELR